MDNVETSDATLFYPIAGCRRHSTAAEQYLYLYSKKVHRQTFLPPNLKHLPAACTFGTKTSPDNP